MSKDKVEMENREVVDVSAKRLFEIFKAIAAAKMEERFLEKFGNITVTISLQDAVSAKSFLSESRVHQSEPTEADSLAAARLSNAMPLDFDHCTRRTQ